MKATETKDKRELESGVTKLQAEVDKLNEQIGLAKEEEKLESLKKRKAQIQKDLEKVLSLGKGDDKLVRVLKELSEEIWIEEKKCDGLRNQKVKEIEALKLLQMAKKRQACESRVQEVWAKVEKLRKELEGEVKRLVLYHQVYDLSIPMKRIQTSSKHFIKMQKKVLEKHFLNFNFHAGSANFEEKERVLDCVIQAHQLPNLIKDGWEIVPDQDPRLFESEPLDGNNSILVKSLSMPEAIEQIAYLNIEIKTYEILSQLSKEDVSGFLKEIEKSE